MLDLPPAAQQIAFPISVVDELRIMLPFDVIDST